MAPWLLGLSGKLWFLCLAKSSAENGIQDKIEGAVFIFHDRNIWRKNAELLIRDAQDYLRDYRYGVNGELEQYFQHIYAELHEKMPELSAFNSQFSITRSGIAELIIPDEMIAHSSAPAIPETIPQRQHVQHILAAQLFFFLRDIGHRHQHHDPHTDTMVDLWPLHEGDKSEWKLQTLFSLYRKIISYKRVRDPAAYASSLGVVAYANTFRRIVEEDATQEEQERLPRFFAENVTDSISSVTAEMHRRQELSDHFQAVTREVTLGAIALLIAIVGVFQITESKVSVRPSWLLWFLAESIVGQPVVTLCFVAAVVLLVRMGVSGSSNVGLNRWLLRIFQPFDLRVSIAVFFALGAFLLTILSLILSIG